MSAPSRSPGGQPPNPPAITVRIPTPLRPMTGGRSEVEANGRTVRDLLADLVRQYPGLAGRLVDDRGAVRRFVNLYVNDQDVRDLGGTDAPTKDGDTLSILPAIAGGL